MTDIVEVSCVSGVNRFKITLLLRMHNVFLSEFPFSCVCILHHLFELGCCWWSVWCYSGACWGRCWLNIGSCGHVERRTLVSCCLECCLGGDWNIKLSHTGWHFESTDWCLRNFSDNFNKVYWFVCVVFGHQFVISGNILVVCGQGIIVFLGGLVPPCHWVEVVSRIFDLLEARRIVLGDKSNRACPKTIWVLLIRLHFPFELGATIKSSSGDWVEINFFTCNSGISTLVIGASICFWQHGVCCVITEVFCSVQKFSVMHKHVNKLGSLVNFESHAHRPVLCPYLPCALVQSSKIFFCFQCDLRLNLIKPHIRAPTPSDRCSCPLGIYLKLCKMVERIQNEVEIYDVNCLSCISGWTTDLFVVSQLTSIGGIIGGSESKSVGDFLLCIGQIGVWPRSSSTP